MVIDSTTETTQAPHPYGNAPLSGGCGCDKTDEPAPQAWRAVRREASRSTGPASHPNPDDTAQAHVGRGARRTTIKRLTAAAHRADEPLPGRMVVTSLGSAEIQSCNSVGPGYPTASAHRPAGEGEHALLRPRFLRHRDDVTVAPRCSHLLGDRGHVREHGLHQIIR